MAIKDFLKAELEIYSKGDLVDLGYGEVGIIVGKKTRAIICYIGNRPEYSGYNWKIYNVNKMKYETYREYADGHKCFKHLRNK